MRFVHGKIGIAELILYSTLIPVRRTPDTVH